MERIFSMKFGTSIEPGGGVLFRLWAPEAKRVELCLTAASSASQELPMMQQDEGWFVVHHPTAKEGDLYQFMIDQDLLVPDPVSRCQATDIHGPSVVCNPKKHSWQDAEWQGRPWDEAVIYELHIGTFSHMGTFKGVTERLDYLADLGITAVQIMPIAQFPGNFNWGYDGALLFAPCSVYGTPTELKELVEAAHQRNMMVFLDVVYNHFGPEGNYLYVYARDAFFTEKFYTPWGSAINFSGQKSRIVRDFYIANVLYWLEEYHMDGLRFDAVHSIFDQLHPDILEEIAEKVHEGPGRRRHIHLILENDHNCAAYLDRNIDGSPRLFTAQWNDDFHHACHILLTGETEGYYHDYSDKPIEHLGRCLTEGFAYQGERSPYRQNKRRGEPSAHLPPLAFVNFLQNHDQIGNRAMGERLISLCDSRDLSILVTLVLLAPSPPLLFMGEEYGARNPFYYFCNFGQELAKSVTEGRRKEFEKFPQFSSPQSRERIPDPNSEATFQLSRLDWQPVDEAGDNPFLKLYRKLLKLRQQAIVPRLQKIQKNGAGFQVFSDKAIKAWWTLENEETLSVIFNLHDQDVSLESTTFKTPWADDCIIEHLNNISPEFHTTLQDSEDEGRAGRNFPTSVCRQDDEKSDENAYIMPCKSWQLLYRYKSEGCDAWSSDYLSPRSIVWLIERK